MILEDLVGYEVKGYRVLSFFIGEKNFWVFECLECVGYCYSFSIYLIKYDYYGMLNVFCYVYKIGEFFEIFVIILWFFNCNWFVSGGGYFWLMFYGLLCWMI